MTKPDEASGSAAKRCSECGVALKPGAKYCDFCGKKVPVPSSAKRQPLGGTGGMLKGIVVACLIIGVLVYIGNRSRDASPPAPPPSALDGRHQAAAVCETSIRGQVRAPFRVIAFRSALVAEERGGYAVSGSVELQSAAGELQRKRYYCKVRVAAAGMVLDEGKMD